MRQKTNYATRPDEIKIERVGHSAIVRFRENIIEYTDGETVWYEADEYTLDVPYNSTLEKRIDSKWLDRAKQQDYDNTSATARAERDKRLASTDWTQVKDAALKEAKNTAYIEYRQALRDVPQQETFPYDVDWPIKP